MPPADDDLLAGRYQRRRMLGSGGMGDVWLADDVDLGRPVAVKRLRVGASSGLDAELVERMLREARVVARLKHPAIVTLHDLVRVEGRPYLIMEYVEGESLADRMAREGPLPWADVARVVADTAGALAAAHKAGVAHRDVKPANVLLDEEGHGHLADFGIARGVDDSAITRQGEIVGTVAYLPPEVARGGQSDAAGDVWSLGATFFAATEGGAPFAGTSGSSNSVPAILARLMNEDAPAPRRAGAATPLLNRMLATDPAQRPTAAEVALELARVLSVPPPPLAAVTSEVAPSGGTTTFGPVTSTTESVTPPGTEPSRRRRWPLVVAVLVLLAGAGVAAGVVLSNRDDDSSPSSGGDGQGEEPARNGGGGATSAGSGFSVDLDLDPTGVALSPDGTRTYLAGTDGTLDVIDNDSGEVVDSVEFGPDPLGPVVATDGSEIYVPVGDQAVAVVDADSLDVSRVQVSGVPGNLRLSDDGSRLYVPTDNGIVAVVDTESLTVVAEIPIGTDPGLVHLTPDGTKALVPDPLSGIVAVIDTATNTGEPVSVRPAPTGLQITADGTHAFVSTVRGVIVGIDLAAGAIDQRIRLDTPTSRRARLRITPDDKYLWHNDPDGDAVRVVDIASGDVVQTIELGEPAPFATFDADGTTAYVPVTGDGAVAAIDTETYDVDMIDAGPSPTAVLLSEDGETLYVVSDPDDGTATLTAVPLDDE